MHVLQLGLWGEGWDWEEPGLGWGWVLGDLE